MKHAKLISVLVVLLLAGSVLALFIIQNYERTTDLSINLIFFSTHLSEPISVPLLIIGTFLGGGLVGLLTGLILRRRRGSADLGGGSSLDDAWA
jgi:uncharacterized integral membrane protein